MSVPGDPRERTLRAAIVPEAYGYGPPYEATARAALDALGSLVGDLDAARRRRESDDEFTLDLYHAAKQRIAGLEADLAEARKERDEARADVGTTAVNGAVRISEMEARAVAAETRLAEATAALTAVRDWIRDGVGTEAEASEAMDAFLAGENETT